MEHLENISSAEGTGRGFPNAPSLNRLATWCVWYTKHPLTKQMEKETGGLDRLVSHYFMVPHAVVSVLHVTF